MKIFDDEGILNINLMNALILDENYSQLSKWGYQKHTLFEWLAYTTEELGELSQAISEFEYRGGDLKNIIKEAVQTATLSIKIALMAYQALKEEKCTKNQ